MDVMKKWIPKIFWLMLPVMLLVMLGFVGTQQNAVVCDSLQIDIDNSNGMFFVSKEDVEIRLKQTRNFPVGQRLSGIRIGEMEKILMSIPEVEKAEVYKSINGNIGVEIQQRTPIVRVINMNGRQFYIDNKGLQMPVSEKFYPRVLVVHGFISEPIVEKSALEIGNDSLLRNSFKSDDIYAMAEFISSDKFWNAQVQEIFFNKYGDMELIPIVGDHRIIFGDTTNMEGKFNKLMAFYKKGLSKTGWNRYDTINLKYKNQIVCSRK